MRVKEKTRERTVVVAGRHVDKDSGMLNDRACERTRRQREGKGDLEVEERRLAEPPALLVLDGMRLKENRPVTVHRRSDRLPRRPQPDASRVSPLVPVRGPVRGCGRWERRRSRQV